MDRYKWIALMGRNIKGEWVKWGDHKYVLEDYADKINELKEDNEKLEKENKRLRDALKKALKEK